MQQDTVKRRASVEELSFVFRAYRGDGDAIAQVDRGLMEMLPAPLGDEPFATWLERQLRLIQVFD